MPIAGSPALVLNSVIGLIPPVTQMWGVRGTWQRKARECVGWAQEGGYSHGFCLPGPLAPDLILGSLQGYLGPQATVTQVQLWCASLAQKAGGGHDAVGLARPQVEGVLD